MDLFSGLVKDPCAPFPSFAFSNSEFLLSLSFGANQQHSWVYLSLPDLWSELSTWADDSYWPTAAAGTWWRSHWGCPCGLSIPHVLLLMVIQHARDCCISHTAFLFYFSWCFSSLPPAVHRLYSWRTVCASKVNKIIRSGCDCYRFPGSVDSHHGHVISADLNIPV